MNIFHIYEIVDIGIEKEKKRKDFYGLCAQRFPEKDMKELFSKLRDWEESHIQKFTEIKNTLNDAEGAQSYPGELNDYVQALVDDKLYREVSAEKFSQNVKSQLDAIHYGIEFEKDAIILFDELINYTAEAHTDVIKLLIEEEKKHIVYLTELRKKLAGR